MDNRLKISLKLPSIWLILLCLCYCLIPVNPANAQLESRTDLTLEILQDRATNPIQIEGKNKIDLSNFVINLESLDNELSQQFYQELNKAIGRNSTPLGIDLSNSIIKGDFQLNLLGIYSTVAKGALPSLFTTSEKEQIQQYYPEQNESQTIIPRVHIFRGELNLNAAVITGNLVGDNSLFLESIIANTAKFENSVQLENTIFARGVDFSESEIEQNLNLNNGHFLSNAKFSALKVLGNSNFGRSHFEGLVEFDRSLWKGLVDFSRAVFMKSVDFQGVIFSDRALFAKAKFLQNLSLTNAIFDRNVTFRDIYLKDKIDLQDVHILDRLDLSNAFFAPQAKIDTSGLAFDSTEAKIIGDRGIGRRIIITRLESNETVLRNLIRNFRSLEQIGDANYLEYQRERLRVKQIGERLMATSWQKVFSWIWLTLVLRWLGLNLLLIMGNYGTNINLLFFIGIIIISFFSFLFWIIDRYRPGISQPIIPHLDEILVMITSYLSLTAIGTGGLFFVTNRPWLTLLNIAVILLPIPLLITSTIYRKGRYHQNLDISYFVEDGSLREFRLLIGRLPIMPRFPFFRDRFQPILWTKRWNWLNYYDFSLNNIFKLGFNDIRLRDEHLPGLISALVWYQWCLGVIYVILLFWTLSRTIPGLNLLIYF